MPTLRAAVRSSAVGLSNILRAQMQYTPSAARDGSSCGLAPFLVFEKNGRTLSPVDRYPWQTDESCVIDLRPNQTVILHLLDDVGGPARHARAREHTCERVRLN